MISDTSYFDGLESYYKEDVLIINVVMFNDRDDIQHLSIADAERIISSNKPRLCVLTHFGMTMIKAKPWVVADGLSKKLGVEVVAASDGMEIDLDKYKK